MKTVYAVRGNHDGTLGIYSTPKKAWARAIGYVPDAKETYKEFRKILKENSGYHRMIFTLVESCDSHQRCEAEIQSFEINTD